MDRKTIILLSAKRCGSTAMFRVFQQHSQTRICHQNQQIENWEPNFWNLAAQAIEGDAQPFNQRLKQSLPDLALPETFDKDSVFQLWDDILALTGPVIFDKSPQYLGNRKALKLIREYQLQGNDVRLFAMIRDARDAIASQYTLWRKHVEADSPSRREKLWLEKYAHLEELQNSFKNLAVFRYEDLVSAPRCYLPLLFQFLDLNCEPESWQHLQPTNVGRHQHSRLGALRRWKYSAAFKEHLREYGYLQEDQQSWTAKVRAFFSI